MEKSFEDFIKDLEQAQQPICNIDNPDLCETCSS
jgi:hypothetical protein